MIEEMHGVGERGLKYDDASKLPRNLDSKREIGLKVGRTVHVTCLTLMA